MLGFTLTLGDFIASTACFMLCYYVYLRCCKDLSSKHQSSAYVLHCSVAHSRRSPERSRHAFTYPLLAFLFPLPGLESGGLSLLCGFLFSYGGIFLRVIGIRASGYLYDDEGKEKSITKKLVKTLQQFGVRETEDLSTAWMMTMPSYLGWEGLNPLTLYFCYKKNKPDLWLAVLEVHNTFSERHVYILETGLNEEVPPKGYDHQWTFPRTFHVSPFNDRLGVYTVALRDPSHMPPHVNSSERLATPMQPAISISLRTSAGNIASNGLASENKRPSKLDAFWKTKRAVPFTTVGILHALVHYPFTLLMTTPRILRQAFILHYRRFLPVWRRPEVLPATPHWGEFLDRTSPQAEDSQQTKGGSVAWQRLTFIEKLVADMMCRLIARRAVDLDMTVVLQAGDPSIPLRIFGPEGDMSQQPPSRRRTLTISYLSHRFFVLLLVAPNARAALNRGALERSSERGDVYEFVASDSALFLELSGENDFIDTGSVPPSQQEPGRETSPAVLLRRLRKMHPMSSFGEVTLHFLQHRSYREGNMLMFLLLVSVLTEWFTHYAWKYLGVHWAEKADSEQEDSSKGSPLSEDDPKLER